jgi:hypothetical protein
VNVVVSDADGLSSSASLQVAVTTRLDTPVAWTLDNLQDHPLSPGTAITLQFLEGKTQVLRVAIPIMLIMKKPPMTMDPIL